MSLARTIGKLHSDLISMALELRLKEQELSSLRARLKAHEKVHKDLSKLKRKIAFYCHPDRGGDEQTMQQVNELFESLKR